MMKKAFDTQDSKCESSGKFTEPRQKEVSGSFDLCEEGIKAAMLTYARARLNMRTGALEEFIEWVLFSWRIDSRLPVILHCYAVKGLSPELWEEVKRDPRLKEPLSIKSISKQVETHQSAKRHSWWNT